jgi:hypothetical protein
MSREWPFVSFSGRYGLDDSCFDLTPFFGHPSPERRGDGGEVILKTITLRNKLEYDIR